MKKSVQAYDSGSNLEKKKLKVKYFTKVLKKYVLLFFTRQPSDMEMSYEIQISTLQHLQLLSGSLHMTVLLQNIKRVTDEVTEAVMFQLNTDRHMKIRT